MKKIQKNDFKKMRLLKIKNQDISYIDFFGTLIILSFLFLLYIQPESKRLIILGMAVTIGILSYVFDEFVVHFNPMVSIFEFNTSKRVTQKIFNANLKGQILALATFFILIILKSWFDGESYVSQSLPYKINKATNIVYLIQIYIFETIGVFLLIGLHKSLHLFKSEKLWNALKLICGYYIIYTFFSYLGYGVSLNPYQIILTAGHDWTGIIFIPVYICAHFSGVILRLLFWESYENN